MSQPSLGRWATGLECGGALPRCTERSGASVADTEPARTFRRVRHYPGWNQADRRRQLTPRDYADPPELFGLPDLSGFALRDGGDEVSLRVARVQHHLVVAFRGRAGDRSGARTARAWGLSRSTWSRVMLGQRWMGETAAAALVEAVGVN